MVADAEVARDELIGRGVEASRIQHMEDGAWMDGPGGTWNTFFFTDPDGNNWAVQEKPAT